MTPSEILQKVKIGMTREEVVAVLGEPDAKSHTTRKYRYPFILKYGEIELTFLDGKDGGLYRITKPIKCRHCQSIERVEAICSDCGKPR